MKKYLFMVICLVSVESFGVEEQYSRTIKYLLDSGSSYSEAKGAFRLYSAGGVMRYTSWSSIYPQPSDAQLEAISATQAVAEVMSARLQSVQDAKTDVHKLADNALLGLLWRTGYLATNVFAVPAGMETAVETDLLTQGMLNPTNSTITEILSRFNAIRSVINNQGGIVENAVWHE